MPEDRFGLELTTHSTEAAQHYVEGLDKLAAFNLGPDIEFDAAIAADPQFALPHVALANYRLYLGDAVAAKAGAVRALELAAAATPREQRQAQIVHHMIHQEPTKARPLMRAHLQDHPLDMMVVRMQQMALFMGGGVTKREAVYELYESLRPHYGDDWFFLAGYAFASNEVDRFDQADRLADQALAARRDNGQAAHARAHVDFETGAAAEGGAFLGGWLTEREPAGFHGHLSWHHALFELALGHHERALAIYDEVLAPDESQRAPLGTLSDAASFLWRCSLYGSTARPLPWDAVAAFCTEQFPKAGMAWVDAHKAMALAGAGDDAGLDTLLDALQAAADRGHPTAGEIVAPVVRAMRAFAHEDFALAVTELEAVHAQLVALGGSNAQRDVFEETLAEAYLRSGQVEKARAFLDERLGRRTTARDLFRVARTRADGAAAIAAQAADLWRDADPQAPETQELLTLVG
jgi:tetratricopeptide (TPR) repeat protein